MNYMTSVPFRIVTALSQPNVWYIFREAGAEVKIRLIGESNFISSMPLTVDESYIFQRFYLPQP